MSSDFILPKDLTEEERRMYALKLEKLSMLEQRDALKHALPHRYMQKHFKWSREFFEDIESKTQVLTAANQIGKSTTCIKKCIEWCVNKDLWPQLWPDRMAEGAIPSMFWYLYPEGKLATSEFEDKWRPLMPGDASDPEYGYKVYYRNRIIERIDWNSGMSLHFKMYAQDVMNLQGGTVWAMFLDEEVPVELLPELQQRVSATDGYMHFVFTATIGQPFWKDVVERRTQWPNAKVSQISLYDCQQYEDGSVTRWTNEKIQRAIDACTSRAEVERRIYGRFVKDEGLKYQVFDREKHTEEYKMVPSDWLYYAGVDYGSGGKNHPSAVSVIAVNPEYTMARLVRFWRGDNIITTTEDVVTKCVEMTDDINVLTFFYDFAARDLATFAEGAGLPFEKAEKSHELGEGALNTLFKSGALKLYIPSEDYLDRFGHIPLESLKLCDEFETLAVDAKKTRAKDDGIDSLRYAVAKIRWNWEGISEFMGARAKSNGPKKHVSKDRREEFLDMIRKQDTDDGMLTVEEELDSWNELLEV